MARKPKPNAVEKPKREPTAKEAAALAAARQAHDSRPLRAEIEGKLEGQAFRVKPAHADERGHSYQLCDTFGTTSNGFTSAAMLHLGQMVSKDGVPNLDAYNASLALVGAIGPQNELEAALAVQMAATHDLSMEMMRRAKFTSQLDQMREYGNLATKLSRTFTAQMKALADHRRGGEQVVRHIHVYQGGQAVVAETVNVGDRGNEKLGHHSHALGTALLGENPQGYALPVASYPGAKAVPDAQRASEGHPGQ